MPVTLLQAPCNRCPDDIYMVPVELGGNEWTCPKGHIVNVPLPPVRVSTWRATENDQFFVRVIRDGDRIDQGIKLTSGPYRVVFGVPQHMFSNPEKSAFHSVPHPPFTTPAYQLLGISGELDADSVTWKHAKFDAVDLDTGDSEKLPFSQFPFELNSSDRVFDDGGSVVVGSLYDPATGKTSRVNPPPRTPEEVAAQRAKVEKNERLWRGAVAAMHRADEKNSTTPSSQPEPIPIKMMKPELWDAINRLSENPKAPPHFSRAFISYLHVPQDETNARRLCNELRAQGITVFLDRDHLNPGQKWELALRDAIHSGTYFIVCFSSAYARRPDNYMQQEIAIALDQLRSGVQRDGWFIPVRFDDSEIPPLEIRPGYTLKSLQWIDLFQNWNLDIRRLLRVVRPPCSIDPEMELGLREVASSLIESKIARFSNEGQIRIDDLEHRWLSLLDPVVWIPTAELIVQLFQRAQQTGQPQTEHFLDKSEFHRNVAITVATTMDAGIVLKHLDPGVEPHVRGRSLLQRFLQWVGFTRPSIAKQLPLHPYSRFIARHRTMVRDFPNWEQKDFAHWIVCEDDGEIQIDLLYFPCVSIEITYMAFESHLREKKGVTLLPHGDIYPTSIISGQEMALTVEHLLQQDVRAQKAKQQKR